MRGDLTKIIWNLFVDAVTVVWLCCRSSESLATENLFLRKQLALYTERGIRPKPTDPATRFSMVMLARFFDWKNALVVVKPETLIRWHRDCFRRLWRKKILSGRRPIALEIRKLIKRMAIENPIWGEERITNELLIKFGIQLSPRTVRRYMPQRRPGEPRGDQLWRTFLRNHAKGIIACDFCVVVTANFRVLYTFVCIEHATRRLVHINVTANPTAEWTTQQLREAVPYDSGYRYLIHDGDRIFSKSFDESVRNLGIEPIRTPWRSPKANAICERVIGTLRRECLNHIIPLSHSHLRRLLHEYQDYYNESRPHSSLGPGIPGLVSNSEVHAVPKEVISLSRIRAAPVLGGLHHAYQPLAA